MAFSIGLVGIVRLVVRLNGQEGTQCLLWIQGG